MNDSRLEVEMFDENEGIAIIKDGVVSNFLYNYIDSASRIAIENYLKNGDDGLFTKDMIENVQKPIFLYNIKYTKLLQPSIHLVYYCGIKFEFINTRSYMELLKLRLSHGKKYEDDVFKIDVFFAVKDIEIENDEIKIVNCPEVDISTDTVDGIKLLEDVDEYEIQTKDGFLITEAYFPIKIDCIK